SAPAAGGSGTAHPSRQRAGAALLFATGGVGTHRPERALAAGDEGGFPQARRGQKIVVPFHLADQPVPVLIWLSRCTHTCAASVSCARRKLAGPAIWV